MSTTQFFNRCRLSLVLVLVSVAISGVARPSTGLGAPIASSGGLRGLPASAGSHAHTAEHPIVGAWFWQNISDDPFDDSYAVFGSDGIYVEETAHRGWNRIVEGHRGAHGRAHHRLPGHRRGAGSGQTGGVRSRYAEILALDWHFPRWEFVYRDGTRRGAQGRWHPGVRFHL